MDRRDILRGAALLAGGALLTPEVVWAAAANATAADWTLGLADVEADVAPTAMTRLHGRAPPDLKGALFRNGPAKFHRPGRSVGHWFDGDGMVRKFQIADGQARMAARFVDTVKRRNDTAADAAAADADFRKSRRFIEQSPGSGCGLVATCSARPVPVRGAAPSQAVRP